ncbi:MAG: Prolyl-tRNA ligase [Candidatus Yanofskybacteria bacterium GW2011_GWF1_44_227]|uniref:Proline--tRNA ligase n=1 Tax=Candidatus Yanofskybacteria bacterium GW2011_GWE2_40_11 TaxID=1619033 RepID=A0A0G0T129_9BACT|nr:MAG: Prolyl-tRNA ligase [Candidatus Yanofskybacteria bacterium GW2011_GWE2_40_11]KKT15915.1 MAG: Prolyl-tRNA ligase [Candidatus Yanofskybacteria bacterium GW2011_GWF2_43_596]KKT53571.1 MAG: Prolyl-tRNA ligase [Candidatus Yanofskybacteria bacterium GW2011_GWF1_44_227]OGN36096.1 MAG: prolyl-tRNA synthetase [Candidatus Yanofskybacteria bacterium RIFOXYA1_FULL_44_17]OGN36302.1 MAG: prolyl-tRNA synthetase [Candidatus Yanofskybacteria bacterium RIFOXYA2_FULL_45_28]OGN38031.1 MAG: prolyl-tRNA synt
MRISKLFTKTIKEAPADETAVNAQLLIRGGFVYKEMAGVYSFLPLGLRVIKKIEGIIREEMNRIDGVEMKTSILQNKETWEKSGRWSDEVVDSWFKTKLKNGGEAGLSFTNEEDYSNILTQHVSSYKDLPIYAYDFKEIFRNEARSKSGILRGREFYWKALYSFSKDEKEHMAFYEKATEAYKNVFNRVGIGNRTYLVLASGGTFSKFSHEFQTICEAGEDLIYISKKDYGKGLEIERGRAAINKEIFTDNIKKDLGLGNDFVEEKAIEVGNIFTLGTRFSEPFGLDFIDDTGNKKHIFMGSYGIGLSRLMGTIVEVMHDDRGIIWPDSIAPFKIHLVSLGKNDEAGAIYDTLTESGLEVLCDDREDKSAGEKFADADLIGCPIRLVVSEKTLAKDSVELKHRKSSELELIEIKDLKKFLI